MFDKYFDSVFDTPPYGTAEEWEKFDIKCKTYFPVHYWLHEKLRKVGYKLKRIRDIKWWFIHRFIKEHRYNAIFLDLKPSYYDPRDRLQKAIEQITIEYIKDNHFVWDQDPISCDAMAQFETLKKWVEVIRPRLEAIEYTVPEDHSGRDTFYSSINNPSFDNKWKKQQYIEDKIARVDVKMLQNVVGKLPHMWY